MCVGYIWWPLIQESHQVLMVKTQERSLSVFSRGRRTETLWNNSRASSLTQAHFSGEDFPDLRLTRNLRGNYTTPASLPSLSYLRGKKLENTCKGVSPQTQPSKSLRSNHTILELGPSLHFTTLQGSSETVDYNWKNCKMQLYLRRSTEESP